MVQGMMMMREGDVMRVELGVERDITSGVEECHVAQPACTVADGGEDATFCLIIIYMVHCLIITLVTCICLCIQNALYSRSI